MLSLTKLTLQYNKTRQQVITNNGRKRLITVRLPGRGFPTTGETSSPPLGKRLPKYWGSLFPNIRTIFCGSVCLYGYFLALGNASDQFGFCSVQKPALISSAGIG